MIYAEGAYDIQEEGVMENIRVVGRIASNWLKTWMI